ncbi:Fungal specific transcription factor domain family protein [Aspergillus niger]|uniref:Fungal specific transcription factor domain family protein n=1 Tax=Aspergillus niger TaxID=5061 RepID=A0A505IFM1_ASPNG|nr:Fungal specific transcription factor domain family protein [Aspergillus niger]GJP90786.1 fungal specific transcription factor domain family protein [Aspergillus niger]
MARCDLTDPAARPPSTSPTTVASNIAAVANPTEVDWDGDADPSNPMNWSFWYRWCHIGVISLLTFVTSLGSSMLAPAVPDVMRSLGSDNAELESFVVSIYVIGYALGPLIAAPMSEIYGRSIVYNVSNVLFLGATIGCALSTNVGMFLAFRLISGCAGVTPLALGGGSIGDLMAPEKMGTAMAIWGLGSLVAPVETSLI